MTLLKLTVIAVLGVIITPYLIILGEAISAFILPLFVDMFNGYIDAWKHLWSLLVGTGKHTKGGLTTMKYYYLSLIRGLSGYYVKFEAESEEAVRRYAIEYFGQMYGTIYTDAYFHEVIRRRFPSSSRVINNKRPIKLTGDQV